MKSTALLQWACVAALTCSPLAFSQILALDLRGMIERADSAVVGTVVARETWTAPLDSPDFVVGFTALTIQGEDLIRGGQVSHTLMFLGTDAQPVSEMPAAQETAVGAKGVFFSKKLAGAWGGRSEAWSLIAAQGGVFRVETGPKGDVVIGKGDGFAVAANRSMIEFRADVAKLAEAAKREKK